MAWMAWIGDLQSTSVDAEPAAFRRWSVSDSLARAIVHSALEVHKILGPGFVESVYEAALAVELSRRAIVPGQRHFTGNPDYEPEQEHGTARPRSISPRLGKHMASPA